MCPSPPSGSRFASPGGVVDKATVHPGVGNSDAIDVMIWGVPSSDVNDLCDRVRKTILWPQENHEESERGPDPS